MLENLKQIPHNLSIHQPKIFKKNYSLNKVDKIRKISKIFNYVLIRI